MWFLLELNTVSFIIILIKRNNYIFDQRIIKYFLFQAITSIFLFLRFSNKYFADYLVRLFIFMKLGIFPFHLWFINILKDLDPLKLIILSTTQKVLPFRLYQFLEFRFFSHWVLFLSIVGGSLYGRVQIKLINIFGASSIYSTSWVVLYFMTVGVGGWYYLIFYFRLATLFILWIMYLSYSQISRFYKRVHQVLLAILILTLSSFPPRPLFFFKITVLSDLFATGFSSFAGLILLVDPVAVYIYIYINIFIISTVKQTYKF